MKDVEIRLVSTTDVASLLELVRGYWAFEGIDGFDSAGLHALLDDLLAHPAHGRIWLATVDGRAAGYLLGVHIFSLEYRGMTAEIDEFFVLPAYRGLGIGARLLATAEESFRSGGCTHVSLRVGRGNSAARGFYQHNGYRGRGGFEIVEKRL